MEDQQDSGIQETKYEVEKFEAKMILKIKLLDFEGKPFVSAPFTLSFSDTEIEGTTDSNGLLEQTIPSNVKNGILLIRGRCINLEIDEMESIDDTKGLQKRLRNLGYDPGKIDGVIGQKTKNAIRRFQNDNPPLTVDGCFTEDTKKKLLEIYSG